MGCDPGDCIALAEDRVPMAGLRKGGNELPGSLKANLSVVSILYIRFTATTLLVDTAAFNSGG